MKESDPIYLTKPFLTPLEEFLEYLELIWEKKQLTNKGTYHDTFENKLAEYLNVKHVSLFSNGTLALISALQTLCITSEVITTPFNFATTTHALHWYGIKQVICPQQKK